MASQTLTTLTTVVRKLVYDESLVHCIYGVYWERESIKSSDFLLGAGQGTKRGIAWERLFYD